MRNTQKYLRVLELVNRARVACDLPELKDLPKGHKTEARKCPIALSLPKNRGVYISVEFNRKTIAEAVASAWHHSVQNGSNSWFVDLPAPVQQFIEEFDNGKYPELVED